MGAEKKARIKQAAQDKAEGKAPEPMAKKMYAQYGLNHVTTLIEKKKAKLVIIAHDVSPIELVVWLPALCRKMDVPYCIVKSKARLGQVVYKKTATALAFTTVKSEDQGAFAKIVDNVKANFND